MTAISLKLKNIPQGVDEMELAELLINAMEAQQTPIQDIFLSCQILVKESIAILEFEPTATSMQWKNFENINIDGKSLQIVSLFSPVQLKEPVPNGSGASLSGKTAVEDNIEDDEGVGSGESSPVQHSNFPAMDTTEPAEKVEVTKAETPKTPIPATPKTSRVVFFDLETTGLDTSSCEIVQIAAVSGPKHFNVFMKPSKGIPPDATKVNGLQLVDGKLLKLGKVVETEEPEQAWKAFIEFLKGLGHVILMGHYAHLFDFPLLVRDLKELGLVEELQTVVTGCVDTIRVFRSKLPQKNNFKLVALAKDYGISTAAAHDALGDVRILSQLCQKVGLTSADIARHRVSLPVYL